MVEHAMIMTELIAAKTLISKTILRVDDSG